MGPTWPDSGSESVLSVSDQLRLVLAGRQVVDVHERGVHAGLQSLAYRLDDVLDELRIGALTPQLPGGIDGDRFLEVDFARLRDDHAEPQLLTD